MDQQDGDASKNMKSKKSNPRVDRRHDPLAHLKPIFLEEYKKCENQTEAAKRVGVNPNTISAWKKDPKFLELFTAAHMEAVQLNNDGLKRTAIQLGIHGNPHYVVDRKTSEVVKDKDGKPLIAYREFYPNLNQFLLKNRLPDQFKDKFEHEINAQIIITLASEFLAILRRHVTPEVSNSIQKELETLSAKLTNA